MLIPRFEILNAYYRIKEDILRTVEEIEKKDPEIVKYFEENVEFNDHKFNAKLVDGD